ncbi:MAG: isoprenyl transferase [Actinomycetota bacterium]
MKRIDPQRVPAHVAIIMDGNGRWATKRGLPRLAGHRAGANAIREVVRTAPEIGIKCLTLYTFSKENWQRPKEEIEGLIGLFEEMLRKEVNELHKNNVKLKVIGHLHEFPESTQRCFKEAMELTKNNEGLVLNVALNYGGRTEIMDAVRQIAQVVKSGNMDADSITEETLRDHLYTADIPDPELLIRTSGELRVSNFLLWQIAYTELWVTPILWPDFTRKDFLQAIYEFQRRKRRFGGLETD